MVDDMRWQPLVAWSAMTSRVGWGVGDQVLSSVTNFALGVIVARSVSPDAFGAYALVFWTYLLILNASRAIASQPLVITASHVARDRWREALAGSGGVALTIGLGSGALLGVVGLVLGGVGWSLVALGIGLPGLLVQDAYRFGFIADGRARLAFWSDMTWVVVMAALVGGLLVTGSAAEVPHLIGLWAIAGLVAGLVAMRMSRVTPDPRRVATWIRTHTGLIPGLTVSSLVEMVAQTLTQYALAAFAGLAVVGAIRAAQLLLSPVTVAYQGVMLVIAPEASKSLRDAPLRLPRRLAAVAIFLVAVALAVGIVTLLLPQPIGRALLGETWELARPILALLTIALAAQLAAGPPGVGLLVHGAASTLARLAIATAPVTAVLTILGGVTGGAAPAALGMTVGWLLKAVAFWTVFLLADRDNRAPEVDR